MVVCVTHGMENGASVSITVVRKVAAREGLSPIQLTPPLHEVVDTDALDALFRSPDPQSDVSLEFSYRGYRVTVEGHGNVTVTDRPTSEADQQSTGDSISD